MPILINNKIFLGIGKIKMLFLSRFIFNHYAVITKFNFIIFLPSYYKICKIAIMKTFRNLSFRENENSWPLLPHCTSATNHN